MNFRRQWFAALLLCAGLGCDRSPRIQFDATEYVFGAATEGDEVAGKFIFRNAGRGVLKIQTPETSCGCTVASVQPDTVKAGGRGEISFKLDLTNARGDVEKQIVVPSNDPVEPKAKLTIKGHVKPVYDFEPAMVFFGDVVPGNPVQAAIRVKRVDGKRPAVTKVETGKESLKASIVPEDQTVKLVVEATASGKAETFSDILSVYTENSTKPAFLIPLAGRFLASLRVEPDELVWDTPDTTTTKTIIITSNRSDPPLEVGNFASTIEDLLVKVDEIEQQRKFELTLKLAGPLKETTRGVLTFDTNFPEMPTVAIPVLIRVAKP